jgi:hypothetical protein
MKFTLVATTGILATLLSTGLATDSFTDAAASRSLAGSGAGIATVAGGADSISFHTDAAEHEDDRSSGTTDGNFGRELGEIDAAEQKDDRSSGTTDGDIGRGLGEKADGHDPDGQGCKFCCGQGCRY